MSLIVYSPVALVALYLLTELLRKSPKEEQRYNHLSSILIAASNFLMFLLPTWMHLLGKGPSQPLYFLQHCPPYLPMRTCAWVTAIFVASRLGPGRLRCSFSSSARPSLERYRLKSSTTSIRMFGPHLAPGSGWVDTIAERRLNGVCLGRLE